MASTNVVFWPGPDGTPTRGHGILEAEALALQAGLRSGLKKGQIFQLFDLLCRALRWSVILVAVAVSAGVAYLVVPGDAPIEPETRAAIDALLNSSDPTDPQGAFLFIDRGSAQAIIPDLIAGLRVIGGRLRDRAQYLEWLLGYPDSATEIVDILDPSFTVEAELTEETRSALARKATIEVLLLMEEARPMILAFGLHTNNWHGDRITAALQHIGPAAVPALSVALTDKDSFIRWVSATALRDMGSMASEALPVLTKALERERNFLVRRRIAEAVGSIGPAARHIIPRLTALLRDKRRTIRAGAQSGLAAFGTLALPDVVALLDQPVPLLQASAIWALYDMGPVAAAAAPALAKALRSRSGKVRRAALYALGEIGPQAEATVPAVTILLHNGNRKDRLAAVWAMGKIGAKSEVAVPALIAALHDTQSRVRSNAAETLGDYGDNAKAAIGPLTALLDDPDRCVRLSARRSLKKIR